MNTEQVSDTPTPETDARCMIQHSRTGERMDLSVVSSDFARQLELERDAARKERDILAEALRRIGFSKLYNSVLARAKVARKALASLNLNQYKE